MKQARMWIGGTRCDAQGGDVRKLVNPATGELSLYVPEATPADVRAAAACARKAFDDGPWQRTPAPARAHVLERLAELLRRNAESLAALDSATMGKPLAEADRDVALSAEAFERCARLILHDGPDAGALKSAPSAPRDASRLAEQALTLVVHEPAGIAGIVVPWSSPLLMAASVLAPALAAGCACVLKPSEETPLSALELARLASRAGVPAGVLNVVTGGSACREALVAQMSTDLLVPRPGSDETEGKSGAIVFADADLDAAVEGVVRAGFANQGQSRSAAQRVLVHEQIHGMFVEALVAAARKLKVGEPLNRATRIGPLVSAEHRDQALSFVKTARKEGARVVCGGSPPRDGALAKGHYLEPTILVDVERRMRVAREEVRGPVLSVIRFKTEDEALSIWRDVRAPRAGAAWTRDIAAGVRVLAGLRAGLLYLNGYSQTDDEARWAGESAGDGADRGLEPFLRAKTIQIRL
jgi:betaine-aldehyde dehydrogenase